MDGMLQFVALFRFQRAITEVESARLETAAVQGKPKIMRVLVAMSITPITTLLKPKLLFSDLLAQRHGDSPQGVLHPMELLFGEAAASRERL